MAEKGTVVEIAEGVAKVELDETSACGKCGLCHSIGPGKMLMEVEAVPGLQPGRKVLLEGGEKSWAASILLFLLPLVDLIIGVILGQYVTIGNLSKDACSAILGAGFFGVSFVGAIFWERRLRARRPPQRARIVMVYETDAP